MTAEIRKPKDADAFNVIQAVKIIREMIKMNPGIEGAIWLSAFNFLIIDSAYRAGLTLGDFENELEKVKEFFKLRLEEPNK